MENDTRTFDLQTNVLKYNNHVYKKGYNQEKILDLSHENICNHDLKEIAIFCKQADIEGLELSGNKEISCMKEFEINNLQWIGLEGTSVGMNDIFSLYINNPNLGDIFADERIADFSILGKEYNYHESFDFYKSHNEYRYWYYPPEYSEYKDDMFYLVIDATHRIYFDSERDQYSGRM